MLLLYFRQLGIEGFQTYSGIDPTDEQERHQWLQKRDLVVDITADQFPGIDNKAVVTRSSAWHDVLEGKPLCVPTDPEYDKEIWEWYRHVYEDTLACLPDDNVPP